MTREEMQKLQMMIKEELKPVHGEIARVTTELRDFKSTVYRMDGRVDKNSTETARLSSSMENMTDWLAEELGKVNIKLDNLLDSKGQTKKEIKEIRKHVGLPVVTD